ncbi:MAG: hypothetical protein ACFB21_02620 [Opitutales bacterium]
MFKRILPTLLSFDIEWVPDPMAAEALFGVRHDPPYSLPDAYRRLWQLAGATDEQPRPFVKTMLCRVVTIAGIFRECAADLDAPGGERITLKLVSLPLDPADSEKCRERTILNSFLKSVGARRPQLVGYNSVNSDVPILLQRAVANGLQGHGFGARPEKPWEGSDYFSTASDYHVDLAHALGGGRNTPRLDEAARVCGIPGKVDVAGDQVWEMYSLGRIGDILAYNEFDAFTTHLLWARVAHFGCMLTTEAYLREQDLVRELAEHHASNGKPHLERWLAEWDRLIAINGRF